MDSPSRTLDLIEQILSQFEVDDNLMSIVMSTKLRKQIDGDKFKL